MDWVLSAWPTQTQAVKWSVPPQNQASPLFSVVPVLPQALLPADWARTPVPARTFSRRMFFMVEATPEERTRIFRGLSSASVSPPGSLTLSIATGASWYGVSFGPGLESRLPPTRSPPDAIVW